MEDKTNRIRVNYYFSQEVKKFIDSQASAYGMSQSAFVTMIVQQYKQQSEAISGMTQILNSLDDLKERFDLLEGKVQE